MKLHVDIDWKNERESTQATNQAGYYQELCVAQAAAKSAGAYLLARLGKTRVQRRKATFDALLDVDLEAEKIILRVLHDAFPLYGVLSEEIGIIDRSQQRRWVVDPLDGSANFQHGNPHFGVAISLRVRAITVGAVLYLPYFDEMYSAVRGGGAYMNGARLHVSRTRTLTDAVVHVGDFSKAGDRQENTNRLDLVAALANGVYRVRMIGTAAADMAYVASGRADALLMARSHPWDYEAGALLVREAGGRSSVLAAASGQKFGIYCNGALHAAVRRLAHDVICPKELV